MTVIAAVGAIERAGAAPDDIDLAEALKNRDPGALGALYDRYGSLAFGLALRMVGDRQTAEEVVQDAFLQLWRHGADYESSRGMVRTWLLSIVRYRCIDLLRSRAVRPQTVTWQPFHQEAMADVDPSLEVERRQTGETIRRALGALPPKQREAIELAFLRGCTHTEIAEQLDIPLGTVKGRIRWGLSRLREVMAQEDIWQDELLLSAC